MPTEKQIRANRANARKSTGPKSAHGKATSSRNALKHGLSAQKILIEGEDPAAFDRFRDAMFSDIQQRGELQIELVEQAISTLWRLKRVPRFEAAILSWIACTEDERAEGDKFDLLLGQIARRGSPDERLGRIMEAVTSPHRVVRVEC
jgi:hypothetical protein